MIARTPVIFQPEVLPCDPFTIRITELVSEGWSEGWSWVVTDQDGLIDFASGDVDYPGDIGFKKALRTAYGVLKSVAAAESAGAH